jgi:hypothetical protein
VYLSHDVEGASILASDVAVLRAYCRIGEPSTSIGRWRAFVLAITPEGCTDLAA